MAQHSSVPRQRRAPEAGPREITQLCHDLRQSLSAGLLLANLPEDHLLDAETRRRFTLIYQTLSHAAQMLDTAGIQFVPREWTMNLSELAQECVSIAEFGHKVRFVSDAAETPLVAGDPLLMHRALDNMIDNAGRAAGATGDVVVRVGSDPTGAWVEVGDDGPGFGGIEHGSGQGLSVVTSAARAAGGRLEISSGPGPGTTVRLTFPRVQEPVGVSEG